MKKKKQIGAALLAASIPGLVFSVSAVPVALGEDASMSSSIVTEEECTWYLLNAPTELALVPADGDAEYEGEALDISATVTDFNVHSWAMLTAELLQLTLSALSMERAMCLDQ